MPNAVLTNLLLVLGAFVLIAAVQWLGQQSTKTRMQAIFERLNQLTPVVVKDVYQNLTRPAKAAGVWTPIAATQAKREAVEALRTYLGPKGLTELAWLLGGGANPKPGAEVAALLESAVESAVHDLQKDHQAIDGLTLPVDSRAGMPHFAASRAQG